MDIGLRLRRGYWARGVRYFWGRLAFVDGSCANTSILGIYSREYHSIEAHIF